MSLNLTGAEQDVATAVQTAAAAWSAYTLKVQYENRDLVDLAVQTEPFVAVETVFMRGHQADMGPKPLTVQYGQIVLVAMVKQGGGTQAATALLDHFVSYLELKNLPTIRTHSAVADKRFPKLGWEGYPLVIPFWYHRVAS